MTVLNYIHHQTVGGQLDALDKIRTFAIAQGWTQETWLTGNRWDTSDPYGFTVTDVNAAYLCLSALDYSGSNTMYARLETYLCYQYDTPVVNVVMSSDAVYTLQASLPIMQNRLTFAQTGASNRVGAMNIGTADFDDMWIFGNQYWIGAAFSMDGVYVQHLHFGCFHVLEDPPTQRGVSCGLTIHNYQGYEFEWEGYLDYSVATAYNAGEGGHYIGTWKRYPSLDFYWDGQSKFYSNTTSEHRIMSNVWPWDSDDGGPTYLRMYDDPFLNLGQALKLNNYAGAPVLMRQCYFLQRDADLLWIPAFKSPVYFLKFAGHGIGDTISYGSEDFLVFPIGPYYSNFGIAVQIS